MGKKHFKRVVALMLTVSLVLSGSVLNYASPSTVEEASQLVSSQEVSANSQASTADVEAAVSADSSADYELMEDIISDSASAISGETLYLASDVVEFIVVLEGESLLDTKPEAQTMSEYLDSRAGSRALTAIDREQATVQSQIEECADAEVEYTYSVVMNGFAVSAPYSALEELEAIPGVKSVTVAQTYDYVEPTEGYEEYSSAAHTSGEMMDSDRANEEGYTGKGTVTAILDTGLDVDHEAFQADPEEATLDAEDIAAFVSDGSLNASAAADDLYKSAKIPFAYDYADSDTEVLGPEDHGTHVAGSVGADCDEFTGVAPDTQLVIMKVFSDVESGASDSWIFAAIEDCVVLGVDTINMSLGTASGFTSEGADSLSDEIFNKVMEAGISLMCAAGNDYDANYNNNIGTDLALVSEPDNSVVGSPSTYTAAVSVASVNENAVYSAYLEAGERHIAFSDPNTGDMEFTTALDGQTLEFVWISGYGTASDFAGVDVEGKIALIPRGSINFTEKEQNAYDAGAVGVIIYDNVEGALPNMAVNGLLPMVSISLEDGNYLRKLEDKTITISSDFKEYTSDATSGLMSDFSSLGVSPDLSLKPEITAPGGNVYSTLPGDTYGNMSGTSMASPHMAGASSVVRQYVNEAFPELSATEAQELLTTLLMNTAVPVEDENGVAYTPRKQGAGLAEVYNAIHTDAYVTVEGSDRPKAELGDSAGGYFSKEFTLTIHNIGDSELTYQMSAIPLTAEEVEVEVYGQTYQCISQNSRILSEEEFQVLFSQETVTVAAGETAQVTVKLRLTEAGEAGLADFVNGTFLDGFIVLESLNEDDIDLSIPYLGFYGDWGQVPVFDDSVYDEEEASIFATAMANFSISTGYGYYLGANLLDESIPLDTAKIAYASRSWYYGRNNYYMPFACLGLLRAPKTLHYSITSADGSVEYFASDSENVLRSFYYSSGDYINYELGPTNYGWDPVYEDEDGYYYWVPDGDYVINITAGIDGTDATQSVSYTITIDNELPELISTDYEVIDGTPYLTLNLTDNNYLMGYQLVSTDGETAYSAAIAVSEDEKGAVTSLTFDVTELQEAGIKTACVAMYDYAMNYAESEPFSIVSKEIGADTVEIINQDIHASGTTDPFIIEAYIEPANAEDTALTWTSSNPAVATVESTGATRYDSVTGTTYYQATVTVANVTGQTAITATASNGVSGSTTVYVNGKTSNLPEDYIIREDGTYLIPSGLSKEVKITENARNVVLVGAEDKTETSPYSGLRFTSDITEGLNLEIQNLHITATSYSVITFAGKGNTLTLTGENSIKGMDSRYLSKALISVAEGVELTVCGTGSLKLYVPQTGYGAGIGGDAGKNAGTIIIDGGTLNITNCSGGAGIGGGSNGGVELFRMKSGTVNVENVLYGTSSYSSNLTSGGACIGSGNYDSKMDVTIVIDGGEINAVSNTNAAVIGGAYRTSKNVTITVNGGKLDLTSNALDASWISSSGKLDGGACLGTSTSCTGTAQITVNGGEILAVSNGNAAAIGSGMNSPAGSLFVYGGTVTAIANSMDTSYPTPAIGCGAYGTAGNVWIDGGSVKAVSANTDNVLTSSGVINSDMSPVYETKIYAPNVTGVMIDGVDWKVSANHPEDDYVYLWMTSDTVAHVVTLETEDDTLYYEVIVDNKGVATVKQYFTVTYDLTNLTTDGSAKAYAGADLTGTLKAAEGYNLPASILVTVGGNAVEASYDAESGAFTVPAAVIGGAVVISAKAAVIVDKEDLQALIADAEDMDSELYTGDSWNALEEALDAAKAVDADDQSDQDAVDAAYAALKAAIEALTARADAGELEALIADAEKMVSGDYLTEGWDAFEEALAAAKAVAADSNATQAEVNEAIAALQAAMDALTEKPDKAALRQAINEADVLWESDYTPESWEESGIEEALSNAVAVYTNPEATQKEVDDALNALTAALDKLAGRADKSTLLVWIERAESLNEEDYTVDSWAALQTILEAARLVAEDVNALQTEVDAAAEALQQALADLITRGDATELLALIAEARETDAEAYTVASMQELEEALDAAGKTAEDPNATQTDMDNALRALQEALNTLTERADKSELEALIAQAGELAESEYTDSSWAELLKAVAEAVSVYENTEVTQDETDAAAALLKSAMEALIGLGDKTELQKAYDTSLDMVETSYTKESWSELETAQAAAKNVLDDANATQTEIDAALAELNSAVAGLVASGNLPGLAMLIEIAEVENLDSYTEESAAAIEAAMKAAKELLENRGTEEEIAAASRALFEALKNAEVKGTGTGDGNGSGNTAGNSGNTASTATNTDATQKPSSGSLGTGDVNVIGYYAAIVISAAGILMILLRKKKMAGNEN